MQIKKEIIGEEYTNPLKNIDRKKKIGWRLGNISIIITDKKENHKLRNRIRNIFITEMNVKQVVFGKKKD